MLKIAFWNPDCLVIFFFFFFFSAPSLKDINKHGEHMLVFIVCVSLFSVVFSFWAHCACFNLFRFLLVLPIGKTIHWERKELQSIEFKTCPIVLVQEYMSLGLLYLGPGWGVKSASLTRTAWSRFTLVRLTMLGRDSSSMAGQVLTWVIATSVVAQMILRVCVSRNGLDCLRRYCQEATPLCLDGLL